MLRRQTRVPVRVWSVPWRISKLTKRGGPQFRQTMRGGVVATAAQNLAEDMRRALAGAPPPECPSHVEEGAREVDAPDARPSPAPSRRRGRRGRGRGRGSAAHAAARATETAENPNSVHPGGIPKALLTACPPLAAATGDEALAALDDVDLTEELRHPVPTLQDAPPFLRASVRSALTHALSRLRAAHAGGQGNGVAAARAWKLFLLAPRMLLATPHAARLARAGNVARTCVSIPAR